MSAWEAVRTALRTGDPATVAARVTRLDEAGRREVAAELPAALREGRAWLGEPAWTEGMRVAGAGTLGGVAAVVSWLNRRDLEPRTGAAADPALLLHVLAARPLDWQADLAVRLTLRARTVRNRNLPLAVELLRRTGATPPEHDPLVAAWISSPPSAHGLRHDPLLPALLPRIFEAEGVGRALRHERSEPLTAGTWLASLRVLENQRAVDRDLLLDGCLRRFLRGGSATDLRFFTRLHELLEPSHDEVHARARDYLRLLPTAPAGVAGLALSHLRRLRLDRADLAEALDGLLSRPERKLVVEGLRWLDEAVEEFAGLDALAPSLACAFACTSREVQDRAGRLAIALADRFSPAGAEAIRTALPLLPPSVGEPLAAAFGGRAADADPFTPGILPRVRGPEPFHPRALPPAALARGLETDSGWQGVESWLASFVRQAADDPGALRDAFARGGRTGRGTWDGWLWEHQWALAMGHEPGARQGRMPHSGEVSAPHYVTLRRFAEIRTAYAEGRLPPYLLATPTVTDGHLYPDVLLTRLEGYERAGVAAMDADLQQALLRLPRLIPPEIVARARALTAAAGRTAAAWLADRPRPRVTIDWSGMPVPRVEAEPTGLELVDLLMTGVTPYPLRDHGERLASWPSVLPSDRDVVAAHCLPYVLNRWSDAGAENATALAVAEGPAGEGTALLLAVLLTEQEGDAVPAMAARGELPAAELGRQLALLVRTRRARLTPALDALETAAVAGAHREVWQVLAGLLPALLPGDGERPQAAHTEALGLAVRVAGWAGARGPLPAVARAAARKGASGFSRTARDLHHLLEGATR
ncbi:hypothetical protein [Nonomuraea sp. bgisy101]|uniref:hypothetical protein n=1 Tax=Nonomuraea sp. bgisy101 TaxID=3413784 RepID=UPI003D761D19